MAKRINLDLLHDALKSRLDQYAALLFPEAKKETKGYRIGDTTGKKGESLWFGSEGFLDHSSGEKGSLIRLASLHEGTTIPAAARSLATRLGIVIENDIALEECKPVNRVLGALSDEHKAKLQARGLDANLGVALGLQSASDGSIAFTLKDIENTIVGIKYHNEKGWHAQPGSAQILWPIDYVTKNFPDADTIYITEGHWDAMAGLQAGFPTVSIPNGASNINWITSCFNFTHSFANIILCYDNDSAGITGLQHAVERLSKGVLIVDYPEGCKDLNDVLMKHGIEGVKTVMKDYKNFEPANVVSAVKLMEQAREVEQYAFEHETPFGKDLPFRYRPHESTVYTAYTGHGKSELLRQIILNISTRYDEHSFIASFEDTPIQQTRGMMRNMGPEIPEAERHRILKNISFYDTSQITKREKSSKVSPKELIDLFTYQYQRYGYSHFVVDNLMTLAIDRQDNSAQSEASELFRQFVLSYPVHLHLVAHPRKPPPKNEKLIPPDISEIRGASEIGDTAFNIIGLVRNIGKERELDKMKMNNVPKERLDQFHTTNPDAIIHVNKQRATGVLPTVYLWFNQATKTFSTSP